MNTLRTLEVRLQNEAPTFHWQCQPGSAAQSIHDTGVPEAIEIHATRHGNALPGSPFHLSGNMLLRWGIDSTARVICDEITASSLTADRHAWDWDKLSEI